MKVSSSKFNSMKFMVIQPSNWFVIILDLVTLVLSVVYFIKFALSLGFERPFNDTIFQYISLVPFGIQILVKLNKGYYSDEGLVTDRKKILKYYLPVKFPIDLIIIWAVLLPSSIPIQGVFFFNLFNCMDIINDLNELFHIQQKFPTTYQVVKLVVQIFMLAHCVACGLHYFSIHYGSEDPEYMGEGWKAQYLISFYRTLIAMMTGGFNDIEATTHEFRIYIIFVCIISIMLFGFTMNMIGQIFEDIANESNEFRYGPLPARMYVYSHTHMHTHSLSHTHTHTCTKPPRFLLERQILARALGAICFRCRSHQNARIGISPSRRNLKYKIVTYMQSRNITKDLQIKVIQSMTLRCQEEKKGAFQIIDESIKEKLPKKMIDEIRGEFFGKIISYSQFLTQFSKEFLYEMQYQMKEEIFKPGDIIFQQNEIITKFIYLNCGVIQLASTDLLKNKVNLAKINVRTLGGHYPNLFFPRAPG